MRSPPHRIINLKSIISADNSEARLYCYSDQRKAKEEAITKRFTDRFEAGLQKISDSLTKPHGTRRQDKVLERIGRLKEKNIRKTTIAEPKLQKLYDALEISASPAGTQKTIN